MLPSIHPVHKDNFQFPWLERKTQVARATAEICLPSMGRPKDEKEAGKSKQASTLQ